MKGTVKFMSEDFNEPIEDLKEYMYLNNTL
jgi:hypothetical protein